MSVVIAAYHYRWRHTVAVADVALPGRQPVVALEEGAIGMLLERTPLRFNRRKVFGNGQPDAAARFRGGRAGIGDRTDL
jgi:hypothetical protein